MKPSHLMIALAAVAVSTGCNADKGSNAAAGNAPANVEPVAPPKGGDWTDVVTQTADGGFRMGNPDAAVKLVEFGSMTCPHCAEFSEAGAPQLVEKYVKTGRVSFEFRNYVRDGFDLTMALIARCAGPQRFFPITDAMFKSQRELFERVQSAPPEQQQALSQSPQGFAQLADLQSWAAQRGLPSAKTSTCLADEQALNQLVQMTSDANDSYSIPGTPSFLINGKLVEQAATWEALEPKIKEALGG